MSNIAISQPIHSAYSTNSLQSLALV